MALTQTNAPYHHIDGRRIQVLGMNPLTGSIRGIPLDPVTLQPTGPEQVFKEEEVFMDPAEAARIDDWIDNMLLGVANA